MGAVILFFFFLKFTMIYFRTVYLLFSTWYTLVTSPFSRNGQWSLVCAPGTVSPRDERKTRISPRLRALPVSQGVRRDFNVFHSVKMTEFLSCLSRGYTIEYSVLT